MIPRPSELADRWRSAWRHDYAAPPDRGPRDARIASELRRLRDSGHRAVRIIDLDCGNGERLLCAMAEARALGFVSIEGRGASVSASGIRHARREAERQAHPSTSLTFEIAEPIALLASEHDGAADVAMLSDAKPYPASPMGIALARVCIGPVLAAD